MLTTIFEPHYTVQLDRREPPVVAKGPSFLQRLKSLMAAWDERAYFRWQLARMARETPELIDDIGLTMAEVNAEIAKPFWRR